MVVTTAEDLPGGVTQDDVQDMLRRELGRPWLSVQRIDVTPVEHAITAPATDFLRRVRVVADDAERLELRLVAKGLQSAIHGLPAFVPLEDRERIAAVVPWRLEAEVYTGDTAGRMPPGLRLPELYGVFQRGDDRIQLWLEDVEPVDAPWSSADLARAATALGRLTVRRVDQVLLSQPTGSFLEYMVENAVRRFAVPHLAGEDLWSHPAFGQAEVCSLRDQLRALADGIDDLLASLTGVPWVNTHGDPTPMNLLRPRAHPDTFVLIDWGTATRGPVGWDVVPLVFGPAENGTASADDLAERLAVAVPAYAAGLATDGVQLPVDAVALAVRSCALLRYPFTSLPLSEALTGRPPREDLHGYARRKAAFVRAVLDVCG
jgi:Phosphotransferase enzyme family